MAAVLTEGFQGSLLQDLDALGVGEERVEMDDAEHIPLVSILGPDADRVDRSVPPLPDLRVVWKAKRVPDGLHGFAMLREGLVHPAIQEERPDQEAQVQEDGNGKDQDFRGRDEGAGYWDDHGSLTAPDRSAVTDESWRGTGGGATAGKTL